MSNRRLMGAWLVLALVMSGNGIFRELVLRDALGERQAAVASAAIGIGVILLVTGLFFRPLGRARTLERTRVSAVLVLLTVLFEFLIGRTVDGKSWSDLIGNYAFWHGHLWPLVLLVLAGTPFLWGAVYGRRRRLNTAVVS